MLTESKSIQFVKFLEIGDVVLICKDNMVWFDSTTIKKIIKMNIYKYGFRVKNLK